MIVVEIFIILKVLVHVVRVATCEAMDLLLEGRIELANYFSTSTNRKG